MAEPSNPKSPKSGLTLGGRSNRAPAPANEAFDKEVDEELQREWLTQLWHQYSGYLLGAAIAVVLGVGIYKLMESRRQAAAEAQGAAYIAAIKQLTGGKTEDGAKSLETLTKSSGGFATLAHLRLAAADAATGKTAEAVAKYDAFARLRGIDPVLADFARLQTAILTLDTAPYGDLQAKLTPLADDANPWRTNARELLGMAALKAGKFDEARVQLEKLVNDQTVPAGIAERARIMMGSVVAADLASKGGAAPAPVPTPAPSAAPAAATTRPAAPPAAAQKK